MPLLCEPNDAVRAVAVAKRREYDWIHGQNIIHGHVFTCEAFVTTKATTMVLPIAGVVSSLLRCASLGFSAKIKSGFSHCDPKLDF